MIIAIFLVQKKKQVNISKEVKQLLTSCPVERSNDQLQTVSSFSHHLLIPVFIHSPAAHMLVTHSSNLYPEKRSLSKTKSSNLDFKL